MPYIGNNAIIRVMSAEAKDLEKKLMTYTLQEGVDITIEDNVVTKLLKSDFSEYGAVAFPEGVTEINLVDDATNAGQPFIANKVIMPLSLKTIKLNSFSNNAIMSDDENFDTNSETIKTQGEYTWDDSSIVVRVKEFVLNEGVKLSRGIEFINNFYLEKINIPSNWTELSGTLGGCINLKKLVIPATVKEFGDWGELWAYSDTIYGYADTAAQTFATEKNIPFVVLGENYLLEE